MLMYFVFLINIDASVPFLLMIYTYKVIVNFIQTLPDLGHTVELPFTPVTTAIRFEINFLSFLTIQFHMVMVIIIIIIIIIIVIMEGMQSYPVALPKCTWGVAETELKQVNLFIFIVINNIIFIVIVVNNIIFIIIVINNIIFIVIVINSSLSSLS